MYENVVFVDKFKLFTVLKKIFGGVECGGGFVWFKQTASCVSVYPCYPFVVIAIIGKSVTLTRYIHSFTVT